MEQGISREKKTGNNEREKFQEESGHWTMFLIFFDRSESG